jgi:hypothetical protein
MLKRYLQIAVVVLIAAMTFSGCPMQGSPVVGAWAIVLDFDCDDTFDGSFIIALYSNNTVELLGASLYSGTWELANSTVTITLPNVLGDEWVLTGTVGTDVVSDGTYTVDGMGSDCWTAERTTS